MIKTLLVLSGAVLLAVPALHAQSHRYYNGGGGRPELARGSYRGRGGYGYGGHNHHYGRYYYYGGVPYFLPFYGVGFGYPGYYYGGGFGEGFAGPYGYGAEGAYPGTYEGRIADSDRNGRNNGQPTGDGGSLPEAVQRQLAKKGYYKGSVDGQFGPASRSALSRFQGEHNLKETGRIDEPTLDALGFTDHQ